MTHQDQLMRLTDVSGSGELDSDSIEIHLNFRLQVEEIANVAAEQQRADARRPPIDKELRTLAYKIYKKRRLRDRIVVERLFGEPAWDMLLALYCLPARGEFLTVTSLSYAADIPQATGMRWQQSLQKQGLIERGPDGLDARKKFMRLTSAGKAMMDRILIRLFYFEPHALPEPVFISAGSDKAAKRPGESNQSAGPPDSARDVRPDILTLPS